MNIVINKKNEILASSLEEELRKIAKDFDNKDWKLNKSEIESDESSTKSRIKGMELCIEELVKLKDHKSFVISVKSWTTDIYVEDELLDTEKISYDVFMYPFCDREHIYRVVLNDKDKLNGKITFLDRHLFRESMRTKYLEKVKSYYN